MIGAGTRRTSGSTGVAAAPRPRASLRPSSWSPWFSWSNSPTTRANRRSTAERHAYEVALVVRNVSANVSRAEAALARFVLDEDVEGSGNIYASDWQLAGYQINQLSDLMRDNPDQLRRVAELAAALRQARSASFPSPPAAALAKQGDTGISYFYAAAKTEHRPGARRQARRDHPRRTPVAARPHRAEPVLLRRRQTSSPTI